MIDWGPCPTSKTLNINKMTLAALTNNTKQRNLFGPPRSGYMPLDDDELEEFMNYFDDLENDLAEEDTGLKQKIELSNKEVYEANKKRDTCIRCGSPTETRQLLNSSINYCKCIEK